ncbi:hypothetical protein AX16_006293 [Volvariella volvacea WC 439]|nr:hypothetical protein AX16_006293 [Volvariella volvacea WC 439]
MRFSTITTLITAAFGLVAAAPVEEPPVQKRAPAAVYSNCVNPNTVALTFDDGPYQYLYDIAGVLWENGVNKATFFFRGCIYTAANKAAVKWIYDNGFQVASHTWSHSDLSTLNWDQLHDQFWRVEQALQRITGATPAFMRPPYGSYNNLVREVAGARGQGIVLWNLDSGDSAGISVAAQKQRYTDIANQHPSSIIALNHETYASTVWEVLPHAITTLRNAGYSFVTVAECLGLPAYQSVGAPQTGSWTC